MWGNFIDAGTVSNVDRPVSFNCNIVIDSDHWLAKTLLCLASTI